MRHWLLGAQRMDGSRPSMDFSRSVSTRLRTLPGNQALPRPLTHCAPRCPPIPVLSWLAASSPKPPNPTLICSRLHSEESGRGAVTPAKPSDMLKEWTHFVFSRLVSFVMSLYLMLDGVACLVVLAGDGGWRRGRGCRRLTISNHWGFGRGILTKKKKKGKSRRLCRKFFLDATHLHRELTCLLSFCVEAVVLTWGSEMGSA
ncbi:hypothetical protein B0T10DRAFT_480820 [Thelonectria olida]|uniref:Uncharacterized protein n=1 Tax=Thelonectria olida TaxID=1576542 RepID=A0A9P8WD72_9HYPO|nr:hypothetical protein B0T10DRAFT_480820 [Thelonectria olida]